MRVPPSKSPTSWHEWHEKVAAVRVRLPGPNVGCHELEAPCSRKIANPCALAALVVTSRRHHDPSALEREAQEFSPHHRTPEVRASNHVKLWCLLWAYGALGNEGPRPCPRGPGLELNWSFRLSASRLGFRVNRVPAPLLHPFTVLNNESPKPIPSGLLLGRTRGSK